MSQDSRIIIHLADNPDKTVKIAEIEKHAATADLIAMQAPGHDDGHMLIRLYHAQGKKVVVDYDDFSFDLSPGNPRYADLGIREVSGMGNKGIFRWRDQENGFDLRANQTKYNAFVRCVKDADLVTTTTNFLADKFRKLNKNVAILPNSVDFDLWKPIPRPESMKDEIRIGWFGGDSHFADLGIFKTVIPKIIEKYKHVKIVLQCPPVPEWQEIFKDIPPDRLERYDWAQLKYYTLFLASRQWDIGLCPLDESLEFNYAKSSIKMFEFSSFKIPSVCQKMIPYAKNVKHGQNGFLASTEKEWFDCISTLVENAGLRKEIGENAYDYVFKNFNLSRNCRLWEEAYCRTIEGEYESSSV